MADYRAMARTAASKYGVDPNIFERQIAQESGFSPTAQSSAGARGIAQLMPVHWGNVDPTDPAASLDYAARLMAGYLGQYNGDYKTALAAFNAGPGNVAKYGGVPPFAETQTYVSTILGNGGGHMDPDEIDKIINGIAGSQDQTTATASGLGDSGLSYGPYPAEGSGVPQWVAQELARAQQEYYAALDAFNKADYMGQALAKVRLQAADTQLRAARAEAGRAARDVPNPKSSDELRKISAEADKAQLEADKLRQALGNKTSPNKVLHLPTGDLILPNEDYDPQAAQELQAKIESSQAQAAYYRAQAANVGVHAPPAPQYPSTITHGNKAFTVDPYTGQISESYDFGQAPPPEPTPYEIMQETGRNQRQTEMTAAQAEQARLQREAENMRNQLTNRVALTGQLNSATLGAVPYMVDPSWTTFPGFEQGGPMAQLYRMGGGTNYQPPVLPKMQFDPEAAWRAAQGLIQ